MSTAITVRSLAGKVAPRYKSNIIETKCKDVVITEKGMESDLPLVDFQLTDNYGNQYYLPLSGRHILNIAGAIKGINLRNHGTEEP